MRRGMFMAALALAAAQIALPTAIPAAPPSRSVAQAVGSVAAIAGDASQMWIQRAGAAGKSPVVMRDYLFPGDRVVARGNAAVELRLAGRTSRVKVTAATGPFLVPAESAPTMRESVMAFFDGLRWPFQEKKVDQAQATFTRGPGEKEKLAALLPSRFQRVPEGAAPLALAWRGTADELVLIARGGAARKVALADGGEATLTADLLKDLETVEAHAEGGSSVGYDIEWIEPSGVPRPSWLAGADALTPAEETAWAAWLIEEREHDYALFAFSMLHRNKDEVFAAGLLMDKLIEDGFAS